MYLPFECRSCKKDKWVIRYDSVDKVHEISCANCGTKEIIEDIFNTRRKPKNVKAKRMDPFKETKKSYGDTPKETPEAKQIN